jgi:hypothetical protein
MNDWRIVGNIKEWTSEETIVWKLERQAGDREEVFEDESCWK